MSCQNLMFAKTVINRVVWSGLDSFSFFVWYGGICQRILIFEALFYLLKFHEYMHPIYAMMWFACDKVFAVKDKSNQTKSYESHKLFYWQIKS